MKAFPSIEEFIEKRIQSAWNWAPRDVSLEYKRGASPLLRMVRDDHHDDELIPVGEWSFDQMDDFVFEKVKPKE